MKTSIFAIIFTSLKKSIRNILKDTIKLRFIKLKSNK